MIIITQIYVATNKNNQCQYAMKVIELNEHNRKQVKLPTNIVVLIKKISLEISAMKSARHPHIVSYVECFLRSDQVRIIME